MIKTRLTLTLGLFSTALVACTTTPPQHIRSPTPSPPDYATAPLNLSTPENTAYSMMIAMYRGDEGLVDRIFTEDGTLNRLRASGEIDRDGLEPWRDWVATLDVGQAREELFDVKVEQFGSLATVWAPFVISLDGEIRGCGVNQFTMAKVEGEWRIVSGIDVQAERETCAEFKVIYRLEE